MTDPEMKNSAARRRRPGKPFVFFFRTFKRRVARTGEMLSGHLQWILDILLAHQPAMDQVLARYRNLAVGT